MRLTAAKWGPYRLGKLFDIQNTLSFNTDRLTDGDEYDYVTRTSYNQGILQTTGYVNQENINPAGIWSLGLLQMDFFYRNKPWYAGQFVRKIIPKIDIPEKAKLFFQTILNMQKPVLLQVLVRNVDETFRNIEVQLPEKSKGVIDFEFIDNFVRELERARLRELEAYLKATGLDNYELTEADKDALRNYKNLQWKKFNIKELFGASTRGRRLKSEDRIPGILPFVTAGEAETGISAFIGNNVTVFESNTTTIDMFGSAKYRNYKYGADDHVAVIHTEKLQKHAAIFVTSACHQAAHTGKFNYGNNFYAKDADELYIMLPTADGKHPDFNAMERLIAAMQKIVIADVAKYTARNLEATQQVIESQEEQQEATITPLHIHDTYQPGRIPLYTLRAACGRFEDNELPVADGWVDASGHGFSPDKDRYFAVHAKGDSMLPLIHDGDICVFEWYTGGSRKGEIVLMQIRDFDPEYDGRYTIKRYDSEKIVTEDYWEHKSITLSPRNPAFEPIVVREDESVRTIGIFKCVL